MKVYNFNDIVKVWLSDYKNNSVDDLTDLDINRLRKKVMRFYYLKRKSDSEQDVKKYAIKFCKECKKENVCCAKVCMHCGYVFVNPGLLEIEKEKDEVN